MHGFMSMSDYRTIFETFKGKLVDDTFHDMNDLARAAAMSGFGLRILE